MSEDNRTSNLPDYIIKRIGRNKGAPRIYLDGLQAVRAGFAPGDRYEVVVEGESVMVELRRDGSRSVSRRQRGGEELPVIDINSTQLLQLFDGMEAVRMVVTPGRVVFLPLASERARAERISRLRGKLHNNEKLLTASLSHGGGVLSHAIHRGLKRAGIDAEMAFANEIREDLIEHAIRKNELWGGVEGNCRALIAPMQEVAQDQWLLSQLPKVEVLEMGLPCQGASPAGKAKNGLTKMEDHPDVGHLVFAALTILSRLQPAVIAFENVIAYADSGSAQILRLQLRDMGYHTHEAILEGRDFGCLENRVRWCMVAVTRGMSFSFADLAPDVVVRRTLATCLDDIGPTDPRWSPLTYLKTKEQRDIDAGKGFRMQVVGPESTSVPTIRKGYAKGGSTDPYVAHPTNPDLLRKFTAAEHARIKGVPPTLVEGLSETTAHELLGQGIVYDPFVEVGRTIARSIQAAATGLNLVRSPAESPAAGSRSLTEGNRPQDGCEQVQAQADLFGDVVCEHVNEQCPEPPATSTLRRRGP